MLSEIFGVLGQTLSIYSFILIIRILLTWFPGIDWSNGIFDNESKLGIKKELGDVLWYVSNLCTELNFNLEDVALQNLEKLKLRAAKGKIRGSGDDR